MALMAGLWWKLERDISINLFTGIVTLLFLYAFSYEVGYKSYLKEKMRRYFYAVFIFPCIVATLGFLYGVFRFYILPPS